MRVLVIIVLIFLNTAMAKERFRWQANPEALDMLKRAQNAVQGGDRLIACGNLAQAYRLYLEQGLIPEAKEILELGRIVKCGQTR